MRMNDVFPSNYLKAQDLPDGQMVNVRIDRVELEELGQGKDKEQKPVVYFVGKQKGVVLNKTNWQAIAYLHGDDSDDWHGKPVQLFRDMTTFGGKPVECIRIKAVRTAAPNANDAAQAPAAPTPATYSGNSAMSAARQAIVQRPAPAQPFSDDDEHFSPEEVPF